MIAQVLFVLGLTIFGGYAIPIDPYGSSLLSSPGISYAAPNLLTSSISLAPKVLAAPAISTAVIQHAAPTLLASPGLAVAKVAVPEPYDPNPQYSFSYGVTDQKTGDSKQQSETLVNGVVQGSYSLAEPDGTIRKVTYTADKVNGFNAIVEKKGVAVVAKPALAVQAIPAITKVAYAAPAITKIGLGLAPALSPGLSLGHY
ncbi:larval cuticle protein A2B [Scaptodrosophila lebanonensis]|uniref:Larval cuticle protein A2B n=1 Tax=Drosophila lebanonensis TaxID=7225 RepID=A0A6J2TXP7_DROLE|nr:larval cuticle protein A2B [Scaptodrosophila lebanonensis]